MTKSSTLNSTTIIKYPLITDKTTRFLETNQDSCLVNRSAYKFQIETGKAIRCIYVDIDDWDCDWTPRVLDDIENEFGIRYIPKKCICKKCRDEKKKKKKDLNEQEEETKEPKRPKTSTTLYPTPMKSKTTSMKSKTFCIDYDQELSCLTKMMLKSFKDKYIYYAIDDIMCFLKLKPFERDKILSILYSPMIYLQNSFSIDFLDIWIQDISITETSKVNKFLTKRNQILEPVSSIRITFGYKMPIPSKKTEFLW